MCSRKLLRENDNVMRPNYRSVTTFCTASVNNVMTFSAYKSDRNIFYKQFNFRLAPQTFGLVTSSNSLPEGQPHLFIFVSPCCLAVVLGFTMIKSSHIFKLPTSIVQSRETGLHLKQATKFGPKFAGCHFPMRPI